MKITTAASRHTSRVLRVLASVLTALMLVFQVQAPATADHGGRSPGALGDCAQRPSGPPRCRSVGNNLRHFVYFDATLTPELAASVRDTMEEDYEPTDLSMFVQTEITPVTDVIAYSQDYGDNGAAGWVNCPAGSPRGTNSLGDRWCTGQEIHFNLNPRFAVFFADDASRDHVACHELGHTLGLGHWGNPPQSAGPAAATCMNANTPDGPVDLHQIDRDHINAYPYGRPSHPRAFLATDGPACCTAARMSPWTPRGVEAMEVESHRSLDEMTRSADAVVRGRAVAVAPGRVFGDPEGAPLHYAAVTVRVQEVLAGDLPRQHSRELTLEVPLFDGPASLEALRVSLPDEESLFFLRNKGESARAAGLTLAQQLAETSFYRLVVFGAVIGDASGRATVTPGAPDFLEALDGTPFDHIVRRIREYR